MTEIPASPAPAPLPNLSAIVAVCDDWGIGLNGDMVVRNRADMRHFVSTTMGATVLMGRKTLESFPGAEPLKGRRNVVVSRNPNLTAPGVEVARSIEEALALCAHDEQVWVIGGGQVYAALLPLCSRAVVTKNHCVREVDTHFPNLDADPTWRVEASVGHDEDGQPLVTAQGVPFEFVTYTRA